MQERQSLRGSDRPQWLLGPAASSDGTPSPCGPACRSWLALLLPGAEQRQRKPSSTEPALWHLSPLWPQYLLLKALGGGEKKEGGFLF